MPFHSILSIHTLILLQSHKMKSSCTLHHQAKMKCRTSIWIEIKWLNGFITSLPYYAWILVVLIAFSSAQMPAPMKFYGKPKHAKYTLRLVSSNATHILMFGQPGRLHPVASVCRFDGTLAIRDGKIKKKCLDIVFVFLLLLLYMRNEVIAPIKMDIFKVNYVNRMEHEIQCIMTPRSK